MSRKTASKARVVEDADSDDMTEDEIPVSYGPIQDERERRDIRLQYRNFIDHLQNNVYDLIKPDSESDPLNDKLTEVDKLFKDKVKMTREAALDSQAMAMISNLGRQKAQALNTEFVVFQNTEFACKLANFINDDNNRNIDETPKIPAENWTKFGQAVQAFFKKSPSFNYMFGSFERGEVHLPPRKTKQKPPDKETSDRNAVAKQPKMLQNAEEASTSEATTKEVEKILHTLQDIYEENQHKPICYFEFVVNPNSFGQTVENMFYTSFLIKDGHAKIYLDDDKLPVIEPLEGGGEESNESMGKRHQMVMVLTKKDWQDIVETFQINEPIIPDRPTETQGNYSNENDEPMATSKRGKMANGKVSKKSK
ncbi:EP300-interacting inhibitor of differentiation 3-like [Tubulanus polymorphus]|uniref:EP300-interacting inhibitor of differentiation 3-like n=1 Tax=Tubulanus polymorphus TaxID=672921 RepID=UPI003DA5DB18